MLMNSRSPIDFFSSTLASPVGSDYDFNRPYKNECEFII